MFWFFKKYLNPVRTTPVIVNARTISSNGILFNTKIEDDLQSVLRPLNLTPRIFFCTKYSIRDNIISSNTFIYNLVRLLCMVIIECIIFHDLIILIYRDCTERGLYTIQLYCLRCGSDTLVFLSEDLVFTISNIMQGHYQMLLVGKIQYLLRVLHVDKKDLRYFICIWTCIIIFSIFCIIFKYNFLNWHGH